MLFQTFQLTVVVIVLGYGLAWIVGGPALANRYLRRVGRLAWRLVEGTVRLAGHTLAALGRWLQTLAGWGGGRAPHP